MPTEGVTLTFTLEFKRNLRALAKKYRSIRSDLQPLIDQLQQGHLPGDQVPGIKFTLFKVRLNNSDAQREARRLSLYLLRQDA
jgi:hypothetical protein